MEGFEEVTLISPHFLGFTSSIPKSQVGKLQTLFLYSLSKLHLCRFGICFFDLSLKKKTSLFGLSGRNKGKRFDYLLKFEGGREEIHVFCFPNLRLGFAHLLPIFFAAKV